MQDLSSLPPVHRPPAALSKLAPASDDFLSSQLPCFFDRCPCLAVQGIALGEASVLRFAVFVDLATLSVIHSKSWKSIVFPSQKWFFGLLTTRHRPSQPEPPTTNPEFPEFRACPGPVLPGE